MNPKLIFLTTLILFFTIFLAGCDELEDLNKPDYITVTVSCTVNGVLFPKMDTMDDPQTIPAKYLEINVQIIKAGGERIENTVYTDLTGKTNPVTAQFKLYREQPISCIANANYNNDATEYPDYTFSGDEETIPWNSIYPTHDFGDTVTKSITLTVTGMHNDT